MVPVLRHIIIVVVIVVSAVVALVVQVVVAALQDKSVFKKMLCTDIADAVYECDIRHRSVPASL